MNLLLLRLDAPHGARDVLIRELSHALLDYLHRARARTTVVVRLVGNARQCNIALNFIASLTELPVVGVELVPGKADRGPITIDDLDSDFGPINQAFVYHIRGFLRV